MRLAKMLRTYIFATDGMSLQRVASEIDVPMQQLHDWINGDETALCARQFARLQCWCFMRAPSKEVAREALPVDSDGGHCD